MAVIAMPATFGVPIGCVCRHTHHKGVAMMSYRRFTTMLAGFACAVAVSGPLLAQAQAPKSGTPPRPGRCWNAPSKPYARTSRKR